MKHHKQMISGILLIALGIAGYILSENIGGSVVIDFLSGFLLAVSVAEIIAGLIIFVKSRLN